MNIDQLLQGILSGPSQEEKSRAMNMGLLHTGLGLLGRRNIGDAGLMGVQAGQGYLDKANLERKTNLSNAAALMSLRKQMEQMDAIKGLYGGGSNEGAPMGAGGISTPGGGQANLFTGQTAPAARGPSLEQLGLLRAAGVDITPDLKLWEARTPKMEVTNGFAYDPRRTQAGFMPGMKVDDKGNAILTQVNPQTGMPFVANAPGSLPARADQIRNEKTAELPFTTMEVPTSTGATLRVPSDVGMEMLRRNFAPAAPPQPTAPSQPQANPIEIPRMPYEDVLKHPGFLALPKSERDEFIAKAGPKPAPGGVPASAVIGRTPTTAEATTELANREFAVTDAKSRADLYSKLQSTAMNNQPKIAKFERIGQLLGDYDGGKLAPTGFELARLGTSLGIQLDPKLSNKEAANALSNEVALELRTTADGAGMPGAMSDADREYLRGMAPQLAQTAEGRKKIIESRVAVWKREQQIANMARQYRQKHGTIDEEFFSQLQGWSDRNPIFNANR